MKNRLAGVASLVLLVGIVIGALWFDHINNMPPLVDVMVERVIDGDTVDVLIGQKPVRIRLQGIDAPELSQEAGQDAQQFLARFIEGHSVRVALDGQDKYGRSLGELFVITQDPNSHQQSEMSVNAFLVRTGRAWAYRYQGEVQYSSYGDLEAQARVEKRGLWKNANAIEPWQWRQAQSNH